MKLVSANADGVKLFEINESIGQGGDAGGVRDQDAKVAKVCEEYRKHTQGIRSDIELLEVLTDGEDWR